MSLINEALKRAQHQRKVDEAGFAPPLPGGSAHRIPHRGKPMASQTLLLIVAGSAVLVVLTVVATVYLLRDNSGQPADRPSPGVPPAAVAGQASADPTPTVVLAIPTPVAQPAIEPSPAAPVAAVPVVAPPVEKPATSGVIPALPAVASTPPPAVATTPLPAPTSPGPVKPTVVKAAPPAANVPLAPDQDVLIYLDTLKIVGVRFSGIDSKVLIGDRVFRVNDVIERNFGLRLVEVQPDRLYFVDARGVAYTKNL